MGEKQIEKWPNCKSCPFRKARVVSDLQGNSFRFFLFEWDQKSTLDHVFLQVVQRRMVYGKYGAYDII